MDPILDIHMLFTKLIGPYVNYLDFKFHDDTYHIKCTAVNFHICSHSDNSNCSGPNNSNTNRDTLINISGVGRNKMQPYYQNLLERFKKVSVLVSDIQRGTLQIPDTLPVPSCTYLVHLIYNALLLRIFVSITISRINADI